MFTYFLSAASLAIALVHPGGGAAQSKSNPLPESESASEYDGVAQALKALRVKGGIQISMENGWLIATDERAYTIWSFAPEGYPAYPAVVKRQAIPRAGGSTVQMSVLCEASKEACDDLVRTFARMNGLPLPR